MDFNRSHHKPFPSFNSPPTTNPQNSGSGSHSDATHSPWSLSSQNSSEHLLLTLPSTLTPGDLAEHPALYRRFPSPSDFLLERPATSHSLLSTSYSHTHQPARSPTSQSRRENQYFEDTTYLDPFTELTNSSPPRSPHASPTSDPSVVDLTTISRSTMDPSNRKRKTSTEASQPSHKRRQPGRPSQRHNLQRPVNPPKPRSAAEADGEEEVEAVDLVDIDDDEAYGAYQIQRQEEMIKQQRQDEADKPVKLSDFQCIICLDNPTDLTVTWCGHLFCSVCLHEALHAGTQKKTCPVCRQTISTKPGGKTKSGVYVLSMKLMTSKKKGKQPAERA